jgi:hypothetical protein
MGHTEHSACALALLMRKLAGYELDVYDEIKRHLAGGDVVRWVDGPMAQCWRVRKAIERMPRGWKGGNNPEKWLTSLHNQFPKDLLNWTEKEIVKRIEWHGREGSPYGGRLPLLRDMMPEQSDAAREATTKKLWIAASVQPPKNLFCDGHNWTYAFGRVQAANGGFKWAMQNNRHKKFTI